MKKLLALVVAVLLAAAMFAGCQGNTQPTPTEKPSEQVSVEPSVAPVETYEIAMITDIGNIDDKSFNQGTWEGIKAYADANGKTYKYYRPTEMTNDAYIASIDLAVKAGAKIIITPGYMFEPPIYFAQDTYPDVKFVLIDGYPNDGDWSAGAPKAKTGNNVYAVKFAEQQVGFLAGYAAVKDGNTKLGFFGGMAVPAVMRYGYGFIAGCDYAAKELGLAKDAVELKYFYTGNFDATPENQAVAASWYTSGTQLIFACGGKIGNSCMAAAEANNGKVIGVDVDQSGESPSVVISAMKDLGGTAQRALTAFYDGTFKGGVNDLYDITNEGLGLSISSSKLTVFSQADYDKLKQALIDDTDGLRTSLPDDTTAATPDLVPVSLVKLTYVK